jgi:glycosyltransferase involved in cell wall biosynthesis
VRGHAPRRLLVVGASEIGQVCAVRNFAEILNRELEMLGTTTRTVWWQRPTDRGLRGVLETERAWLRGVGNVLDEGVDGVLWHYTPVANGHRGIPVGVPAAALRFRRAAPAFVTFAHEFETPLGWDPRHVIWAATQAAALSLTTWASDGMVVATERRKEAVLRRRSAPHRPVLVSPIFSNVARDARHDYGLHDPVVIGVFSFTRSNDSDPAPLAAAVALLRAEGVRLRVRMIGRPGEDTEQGQRWKAAFPEGVLEFTGLLDDEAISAELTACDLAVFCDPAGPVSRRGSLAAWLTHGVPLVAYDGPATWPELARAGALLLAEPTGEGVAGALRRLIADPTERERLGAAAEAFSVAHMQPHTVAAEIQTFFSELPGAPTRTTAAATPE